MRLSKQLAMLVVALASTAISAEPSSTNGRPAVVTTDHGDVVGVARPSGVNAYLGIPYAAPPVRELRWRAPQPAQPWQGQIHADKFAPQCVQPMRSNASNQYSGAETISEDCLYLNVWAKPGLTKAPVIVYIHGGAFYVGSSSMGLYGGDAVGEAGAVFVNLNYRLGPLGFLALPELRSEAGNGSSGNYGLLDQIAALQWVRRNIASFGGDPDNVTIVGQSAGSMSVLTLQASPLAKELFQRAVGMSGAMIDGPIRMATLQQAESDGTRLKEVWKAKTLADLRDMPADRLVVPRVPGGPSTGPAIDGHVLPAAIPEIFAAKHQNDVPLLVGFTHDESLGGLGAVSSRADYEEKARSYFGDSSAEFLKRYPATSDAEAKAQARAADRDGTMVLSMFGWASLQALNGRSPVYAYEFSRPHNYVPGIAFSDLDPATAGAYHTSEVPFWLGTIDSFNRFRTTREWTLADRAMSNAMLDALLAFAQSGQPKVAGLAWPRFQPGKPRLIEFGATATVQSWPAQAKLDFLRKFYAARAAGVSN